MFSKCIFFFLQKIENEDLTLVEQLKQANVLLDKINQVLRKKLEEINQLRINEEKLCNKLDEKPIEFENEGKHKV